MYWLCAEKFRGSGRVSRIWVEESSVSPDTPEECTGQYDSCKNAGRAPWSHAMAHLPYPFNGMGGQVLGGFSSQEAALDAEAAIWDALEG